MSALARFLIGLAMGAVYGWGAALLWAWFAVPLGAVPVTMWHAWGLLLGLSFVKLWFFSVNDIPLQKHENEDGLAWGLMIVKLAVVCLIVGMGWLLAKGVA